MFNLRYENLEIAWDLSVLKRQFDNVTKIRFC